MIPPPAATEPTFASLMPTPPPGIAPLLSDGGFDFTRPSSAPPAAAQESDSGAIRLSDLSSSASRRPWTRRRRRPGRGAAGR
ncbi:hypothetical protein [Dactylosporangium cerinum]